MATPGIAVLKALVPQLNVVAGFQKVKMFGPVQGRDRNDSIVAYCTDKAAQAEVVRVAAGLNPGNFQPDLPNWVKVKHPGIGIADEPPQTEVFHADTGRQSFGKFLSKVDIYLTQVTTTCSMAGCGGISA